MYSYCMAATLCLNDITQIQHTQHNQNIILYYKEKQKWSFIKRRLMQWLMLLELPILLTSFNNH